MKVVKTAHGKTLDAGNLKGGALKPNAPHRRINFSADSPLAPPRVPRPGCAPSAELFLHKGGPASSLAVLFFLLPLNTRF